MNAPNGSRARELWDSEEVEQIERDWADLERVEEVIKWLGRWITAAPKPVPHVVFGTLVSQQLSSSDFLVGQSWDDQAYEIHSQLDRLPEPHPGSTADLWKAVNEVEVAFEWLDQRLRQARFAPSLVRTLLDIYVELWIDHVESASRIPMARRAS